MERIQSHRNAENGFFLGGGEMVRNDQGNEKLKIECVFFNTVPSSQ